MYFLDVYNVTNPYTDEYERIETFTTSHIPTLFERLGVMKERYKDADCCIIVMAKGEESRKQCLRIALKELAYIPKKTEIN